MRFTVLLRVMPVAAVEKSFLVWLDSGARFEVTGIQRKFRV